MHTKSVTGLHGIVRELLNHHYDADEAWLLFRDEAIAQFSAEDDGDRAAYIKEARKIFNAVVEEEQKARALEGEGVAS